MSVALLLLIFGTVSGVDLLVGARTSGVNLLLYSVFRIGAATNNISWQSYKSIAANPEVAWTIPLSLGDSHRGFRVVGTSGAYFDHFRYRDKNSLSFQAGQPFKEVFEVVLGADVARDLKYQIGDAITLTHGISSGGFGDHDNKPFRVVGVLEKTGTAVDRSVHVPLEGISAVHADWQNGAPPREGEEISAADVQKIDLSPDSITAVLVGLNSKIGIFKTQRAINQYQDEALMAVLPGITMTELWQIVSTVDSALVAVTSLVILTSLIALTATMLSTLHERRREIAVLRSVGASVWQIFGLLFYEAFILTLGGVILGVVFSYLGVFLAQPVLEVRFGISLPLNLPGGNELKYILGVILAGMCAGILPAYAAYKSSLADGLTVKL
jgi:putative ABC transport system permease protein